MALLMNRLYKASIEGSLTTLYDLLQEDEVILDRCTTTSYAETPLHLAAMLGHFDFCCELLSRKAELAGELDSRRSSPLHLASAKGHVEIVKILLRSRPEMCSEEDGDGNNPIHLAAMKGRVDVLKELVRVNLDGAFVRARICGGTIFHLCVEYYQFDALKFLIETMNNKELVDAKNDDGNTILHLAIINKQLEIIQYLIASTQIDASTLNCSGLTALDHLIQTQRESKYIQVLVHSLQLSSSQSNQQTSSSTIINNNENLAAKKKYNQSSWLEKQQSSIMVVASLIATMAFQAGISPQGGFWQDDSDTHHAGNPIWKDKNRGEYQNFCVSNTISFLSSLSIILFLISGLPLKQKLFTWILTVVMWISISSTAITYGLSVGSHLDWLMIYYLIVGWIDLMGLLILIHTIRFVCYCISHWSLKYKVFFWIIMTIMFISIVEFVRSYKRYFEYIDSILFWIGEGLIVMMALAWTMLVAFLVMHYVYRLVAFLVRKMITC